MAPVQLFPLDWKMKDLPRRLGQLRTARKIRQTRVAEPQFATVVKIAGILNVTLDELGGRQDSSAGDARIQKPVKRQCTLFVCLLTRKYRPCEYTQ